MKTMRVLILYWAILCLIESVYAQERYAVLITGDYRKDTIVPQPGEWNQGQGRNPDGDFEEFWNDTFLMWELLQSKGYATDNIFVLFDNGQDYYLNNQWVDNRYRPSDP